ncbi:lymphocyte antigen 6D-like [Erinaceus europaeus]|uniref:Lymphocyte antigen 6D-like n=1 Tax=Erinaceus europaeus TaxID=9365 RepID=A0A1S3AIA8_ERIEU|nr:lymphocyte antigen 6D-like [Erinaceus europaeus]
MAMRPYLFLLLPLLLLACTAQALKCHECTSDKGTCLKPTTCQATARYCLTTWNSKEKMLWDDEEGPPGLVTRIIKSCAYTCPGVQESLASSRAFCCNTDLCNSVAQHGASWGLLVLSMWVAYLNR